jgi:HK97 gp10 family phage protein
MTTEIEGIKGLSELQKVLDEFPVKLERNIMRGAMRAGCNVMKKIAKANCPQGEPTIEGKRLFGHHKGLLKESIRVAISMKKSQGGKIIAEVRAGGEMKNGAQVYYAHMVERDTRPHKIEAGIGKRFPWGGKVVNHPGTKGKAFMRHAFDHGGRASVEALREYIRKRLLTKHGIEVASEGPA